jgi:hypothetical protein
VFGALPSILEHFGNNEHDFEAALQYMLEAVHATLLQMQGLEFTTVPEVEAHTDAAKQMHL